MLLKNTGINSLPIVAKLACVALSLFMLGAVEITARLLYREERELYKILDLLEPDRELLWVLRPRLNAFFQGVDIGTNRLGLREKEIAPKAPGALRVLCLGASPTFGWGVTEADRYSNILQDTLGKAAPPGKNIEVINAGVIGYSSYQGAVLLKKLLPALKPDIVTIPFAVNDVDKYRFFQNNGKSDNDIVPPGGLRLFIERAMARSRLAVVVRRAMFGWHADSSELKIKASLPFAQTLRVSAADYARNLLGMAQEAGEKGVKVIFVRMPVYNPFPRPAAVSERDLRKADELWAAGLRQAEEGNPVAARIAIERALEYVQDSAKMYNMLGRLCYGLGLNKEARFYFDKEKKMELRACIENIGRYGDIMGQVSARAGVAMADVAAQFKAVPRKDIASLFFEPEKDMVHLSPRGHTIVAKELAGLILEQGFVARR